MKDPAPKRRLLKIYLDECDYLALQEVARESRISLAAFVRSSLMAEKRTARAAAEQERRRQLQPGYWFDQAVKYLPGVAGMPPAGRESENQP